MAWKLIPLVNANYSFEFSPTTDEQTGAQNPRRQELGTTAGLALYPGTWLQELRLGAITKTDLVARTGGFQPGVELGWRIARPLGPLFLTFDANLKNYFLTPTVSPDELGFMGDFSPAVAIPLVGGLSVDLGLDYFVFNGKVASNLGYGYSLTPRVGLSYNATWKPALGLVY